jgi:hypothetical protein
MEGYRKAWENISEKLESKQNAYAFNSENKYMNNTGEKMLDTDHFGTVIYAYVYICIYLYACLFS